MSLAAAAMTDEVEYVTQTVMIVFAGIETIAIADRVIQKVLCGRRPIAPAASRSAAANLGSGLRVHGSTIKNKRFRGQLAFAAYRAYR